MKITGIIIAPKSTWSDISEDNPLRATVKLQSDETTVSTVLSGEDHAELLHLVEYMVDHIIARAAKRNVEQFVAAVSGNHSQMIEGE